MAYKKTSDLLMIPNLVDTKVVNIIFVYKEDIEDELDEQILYSNALKYIQENEEYDVICYRNDIWFGITNRCFTCVYVDFNDDDIDVKTAIRFVDNRKWKLNAGFMKLENVYTKIIITGMKSPESLFKSNKRWNEKIKSFNVVKCY